MDPTRTDGSDSLQLLEAAVNQKDPLEIEKHSSKLRAVIIASAHALSSRTSFHFHSLSTSSCDQQQQGIDLTIT
jgi:hypothetical protein